MHLDSSAGKESVGNTGDTRDAGSVSGLGSRAWQPWYSFLKNPMDREAW